MNTRFEITLPSIGILTLLVTHTPQCALHKTALSSLLFKDLPNDIWGDFSFFNRRVKIKGNRICFYFCNYLEHHFSNQGRGLNS